MPSVRVELPAHLRTLARVSGHEVVLDVPAPPTIGATLDALAKTNKEKLDWKHSIVDLMKLLNLDSSLTARKELAKELNYTGDTNDSATMNIWLHKQVIAKLAANGGKLPADMKS